MTTLAEPVRIGSRQPRLATPPLRPLTPETTEGFAVIEFAESIGHPLLPWQQEAVIRGLEILPDGRPRFRILLLLIARQQGKTELLVILAAYWMFKIRVALVFGCSAKQSTAMEPFRKMTRMVERTPELVTDVLRGRGGKWYKTGNNLVEAETIYGCRYQVSAANADGGRGLTIDRAIVDELRQQENYEAWEAAEPACSSPTSQIWALSNAGQERSVVLNDHRASAIEFIDTGMGDYRLGLLEWSSPEGAEPDDVEALLQANPRVGYGYDLDTLLAKGRRAKRLGGRALTGFQTEFMCQNVQVMDPAIEPRAWTACLDPGVLGPEDRPVMAIDVSRNGQHATMAVAAVLGDGRVRVETVGEWKGPRAISDMERDLPGWAERIKPSVVGWFPAGPAAAAAARLTDRRKEGVRGWPPRGATISEIRGEVSAVCMGLAKEVVAGTIAQSGQEMLDAQIGTAEKEWVGSAWVFTRRAARGADPDSAVPVDAVYAVAAAVHLARTSPRRRRATKMRAVEV